MIADGLIFETLTECLTCEGLTVEGLTVEGLTVEGLTAEIRLLMTWYLRV